MRCRIYSSACGVNDAISLRSWLMSHALTGCSELNFCDFCAVNNNFTASVTSLKSSAEADVASCKQIVMKLKFFAPPLWKNFNAWERRRRESCDVQSCFTQLNENNEDSLELDLMINFPVHKDSYAIVILNCHTGDYFKKFISI